MNSPGDEVRKNKDRMIEQLMMEQIREYHFPPAAWERKRETEPGEKGVPMVSWEHFRSFLKQSCDVHIPRGRQFFITRHPDCPFGEHMHDHYKACYVLSGSCTAAIGSHLETLHEGDFCLVPPRVVHDCKSAPESVLLCFAIHPSLFKGTCSSLLEGDTLWGHFLADSFHKENQDGYLLFQTGRDMPLKTMAVTMFQIMMDPEEKGEHTLENFLLPFFARMGEHPGRVVEEAPSGARMSDQELLNMIRKNFATITLADLARQLHYTVPHCSKYLKSHLGANFSQLVRQVRFQTAREYLIHSDLDMTRISEVLGYENPENFIRAFKKVFGVTPNRYRLMNR